MGACVSINGALQKQDHVRAVKALIKAEEEKARTASDAKAKLVAKRTGAASMADTSGTSSVKYVQLLPSLMPRHMAVTFPVSGDILQATDCCRPCQ